MRAAAVLRKAVALTFQAQSNEPEERQGSEKAGKAKKKKTARVAPNFNGYGR